MIILDTNVLSELMRPAPSVHVLRWFEAHPADGLFTTTVTQAEIFYGLEMLPAGKRRIALQSAIERMFEDDFSGRVLPFDGEAARMFATIAARRRELGTPISQFDAQITGIARARSAALATRNTTDFADCGIAILDPWNRREL